MKATGQSIIGKDYYEVFGLQYSQYFRADLSVSRTDMKTYFQVAVKDGFINVLILQLAGKKRMNVADFLRGYRTSDNNKVE